MSEDNNNIEDNLNYRVDVSEPLPDNSSKLISSSNEAEVLDFHTLRKQKKKPLIKDPQFIKLVIMLFFILFYTIAELVVGAIGNSLSLISDAVHMLSDALGFVIAMGAILASRKEESSPFFSYGLVRGETLGGLVNAIFLISASLFIILNAIERMIRPDPIGNAVLILSVGSGGLLVNLIGVIMFCGHAHHHDEDDHKHNDESEHHLSDNEVYHHLEKEEHHHASSEQNSHQLLSRVEDGGSSPPVVVRDLHDEVREKRHSHQDLEEELPHEHHTAEHNHQGHHHKNDNMIAVILHLVGDFFGSIAVMISAGITLICRTYAPPGSDAYTQYLDPAVSLIIALILLFPTFPIVYRTCKLLMQGSPSHILVSDIKRDLLSLENVKEVHDLHVWSLTPQKIIGNVHLFIDLSMSSSIPVIQPKEDDIRNHDLAKGKKIKTDGNNIVKLDASTPCELTLNDRQRHDVALAVSESFNKILKNAKRIFHKYGIHSTTIQLEPIDSSLYQCNVICSNDCYENWCCVPLLKSQDKLHPPQL